MLGNRVRTLSWYSGSGSQAISPPSINRERGLVVGCLALALAARSVILRLGLRATVHISCSARPPPHVSRTGAGLTRFELEAQPAPFAASVATAGFLRPLHCG